MSGIVNKVKSALHSDHSSSTTHGTTHSGTAEGVAGPHSSRAANAADPRVDSDLDGSRHTHTGATGTTGGLTGAHGTTHGTTGVTGTHGTTGGLTGTSHQTHGTTGGLTGTSHQTHGTTGGVGHSGPVHDSNIANKLDPRVDATSANTYGGTHAGNTHTTGGHSGTGGLTGTGTTGGISHSTNAGPHDSNVANKVDPRVDSDLDGRGNRHGAATGGVFGASGSHATAGSGTAQNTAGPHNSDMLNKVDPRVDSDRDGSNTVGGNRTHA